MVGGEFVSAGGRLACAVCVVKEGEEEEEGRRRRMKGKGSKGLHKKRNGGGGQGGVEVEDARRTTQNEMKNKGGMERGWDLPLRGKASRRTRVYSMYS